MLLSTAWGMAQLLLYICVLLPWKAVLLWFSSAAS